MFLVGVSSGDDSVRAGLIFRAIGGTFFWGSAQEGQRKLGGPPRSAVQQYAQQTLLSSRVCLLCTRCGATSSSSPELPERRPSESAVGAVCSFARTAVPPRTPPRRRSNPGEPKTTPRGVSRQLQPPKSAARHAGTKNAKRTIRARLTVPRGFTRPAPKRQTTQNEH